MTPHVKARIAFRSAALLLLLIGVLGAVTLIRLRINQNWLIHSSNVERALLEVNFNGTRAAQFRSSYTASGNPSDLEQYQAAKARILEGVQTIQQVTRDNPIQHANAADLEAAVRHRIQIMDDAVALKRDGRSTPGKEASMSRDLVAALGANNDVVERMAAEEQELLDERIGRTRRVFLFTAMVLALASFSSFALFFLYSRLLHAELRARRLAEVSLRELTARVLQIQDDERRRVSRELHDSIGQYLAAVKISLSMLFGTMPGNAALADAIDLVDKATAETRTISYLLHPPLLDEVGLPSAVRWYVEGVARRSGFQVEMDFAASVGRLPRPVEIALFRVIQEALTNIHRHAETDRAVIKIERSQDGISLRIRDFGKGMSPPELERIRENSGPTGVGLAGMRERIAQLGGRFEIHSDGQGTLLSVLVPVPSASNEPMAAD